MARHTNYETFCWTQSAESKSKEGKRQRSVDRDASYYPPYIEFPTIEDLLVVAIGWVQVKPSSGIHSGLDNIFELFNFLWPK